METDAGGMTDFQWKSALLDEREKWRQVLALAEEERAEKTAALSRRYLEITEEKLKF